MIIVFDDDLQFGVGLKLWVTNKFGTEVKVFHNQFESMLLTISEIQPEIVLIDVSCRKVDEIENLLQHIFKNNRLRVILTTVYDRSEYHQLIKKYDHLDCVKKCDIAEYINTIYPKSLFPAGQNYRSSKNLERINSQHTK